MRETTKMVLILLILVLLASLWGTFVWHAQGNHVYWYDEDAMIIECDGELYKLEPVKRKVRYTPK